MPLDDVLASQIVFHLGFLQMCHELLEGICDAPERFASGHLRIVQPQACRGLQYQPVIKLLPLAEQQREAGKIVVQYPIVLPPGRDGGKDRRVVVLAGSGDGHVAEVLVHEVDAKSVLPVAQPLEVSERLVPSAAAIGLA